MTIHYLTNATAVGAPTLTGAAGSLIALLDYLLVTTLGWTKAFSGTNTASYHKGSIFGNDYYLGVDDSATLNTRVRGFKTMTAAGVSEGSGTEPFPTDTLLSGGLYVFKSADTTTARTWRFASDGTIFYLSIKAQNYYNLFCFGDIVSYKAADGCNTFIAADTTANAYAPSSTVGVSSTYMSAGNYLSKNYTLTGGAVLAGKVIDGTYGQTAGMPFGYSGVAYPSPIEGGLLMCRTQVSEAVSLRGLLPGIWNPLHAKPLVDGDTFAGTGTLTGRTFVAHDVGASGQLIIETSDTWG